MSWWFRTALLMVVASIAMPAAAQEVTGMLKKIKDTGTLSVGYAETAMPFSYFDSYKRVIGYSIDICTNVIDAIKAELKKPDLKVDMRAIKPEDAMSYVVSGVVDLHCGPILNTWDKKSRVDFGATYFVQRFRFASHESAHMNESPDMAGRSFVTTAGSPAMTALQALNNSRNLGVTVVPARTDDDAFRIFHEGGAQAIFLDEITLAQGVAKSPEKDPALVTIGDAAFGAEPFSLIYVKGDAPLKKVVADAMQKLYASDKVRSIYRKWFMSPIPTQGVNLNLPASVTLDRIWRNPTDSPDPALYQ